MGDYLLKGYRMLATTCNICGTIELQDKQVKGMFLDKLNWNVNHIFITQKFQEIACTESNGRFEPAIHNFVIYSVAYRLLECLNAQIGFVETQFSNYICVTFLRTVSCFRGVSIASLVLKSTVTKTAKTIRFCQPRQRLTR